jgi:mono/diheme cytochrome c family protein
MTGSTRSCPRTERLDAPAPAALPPAARRDPGARARCWVSAALLGLISLPVIAPAQEFKPPSNLKSPEMIAEGRAFYNRRCTGQCHGVDGGEAFDGSILIGKPYLDPTFVYVTLITGRPGSAMPSWKGRLTDDELWKVIAFVSSLGDQARAKQGE